MRLPQFLQRFLPRAFAALLALALLTLFPLASAQAGDLPITWYAYTNLQPLYINEGLRKDEGIVDFALRQKLLPALGGIEHKIVDVPLQRIEMLLKTEENSCVLGLFKNPERETFMLFSRPFLVQLPPGALVRRDAADRLKPYLDAHGKLSLARLLADGKLIVGISSARSYGATIDGLLAPYQGKDNVFVSRTTHPLKALMTMQQLGRVDVVPGFAMEATYIGLGVGGAESLRFYPLSEQPDYVFGHAACARSEAGATVIRRVDAVLAQREVRDAIAAYYESWLDPEPRALVQRLRKQAERVMAGTVK